MLGRIVTAAALGLLVTTAVWADDEPAKSMTIGDVAPPIDVTHWLMSKPIEGQRRAYHEVTDFEPGKVYVLEFWATWCGPCLAGMPHLTELQERFADRGVTIISISDEPLQTVVSFLISEDARAGVHWFEKIHYTLAADPDRSVMNDYFRAAGQRGIPCAFIVGKEGHVEWIGHPMRMDEPLEQVVSGQWDRHAFKSSWEEEQAVQRRMTEARAKMAAAQRAEDWPALLKVLDELIEEFPDNASLLTQKFGVMLTHGDDPIAAYELGHRLMEANWDSEMTLNQMAWMIVDDEAVKVRNLTLALKAAQRANTLADGENPAILDTLARVHFELGDLKSAIAVQAEAVERAGDDAMGQSIREALARYMKAAGIE